MKKKLGTFYYNPNSIRTRLDLNKAYNKTVHKKSEQIQTVMYVHMIKPIKNTASKYYIGRTRGCEMCVHVVL